MRIIVVLPRERWIFTSTGIHIPDFIWQQGNTLMMGGTEISRFVPMTSLGSCFMKSNPENPIPGRGL